MFKNFEIRRRITRKTKGRRERGGSEGLSKREIFGVTTSCVKQ